MKKKKFSDGGVSGGISGGLPPLDQSPSLPSSLSNDQIAGKMKELKLRQTYGPTQNERDRIERSDLASEYSGQNTVHRSADGKSGSIGPIKKMAKGGSASSRADGCAQRGKTRGRMV